MSDSQQNTPTQEQPFFPVWMRVVFGLVVVIGAILFIVYVWLFASKVPSPFHLLTGVPLFLVCRYGIRESPIEALIGPILITVVVASLKPFLENDQSQTLAQPATEQSIESD
ncbi:MAG: hypothetical protein ACI93T_002278 [Porticoccaceae bacterium]|jgi:hypothetical protein